eukprot:SAG11_NODE_9494_length_906_cov_54.396530_1_plen_121_part_00
MYSRAQNPSAVARATGLTRSILDASDVEKKKENAAGRASRRARSQPPRRPMTAEAARLPQLPAASTAAAVAGRAGSVLSLCVLRNRLPHLGLVCRQVTLEKRCNLRVQGLICAVAHTRVN